MRIARTLSAGALGLALAAWPGPAAAQQATITAAAVSGNTVVLIGTNLQNPTQVTVGGQVLTGLSVDPSGTQLTGTTPITLTPGTYLVTFASQLAAPPSSCATVQPAPTWLCVNGGWLPPDHPAAHPPSTSQALAFTVSVSSGVAGPAGPAGSQGPIGPAGPTGATGVPGATGPQGIHSGPGPLR